MLKRTTCCAACLCLSLGFFTEAGLGQAETASEDEIVDSIRRLSTISPNDQQRIADWVRAKLDKLVAIPEQNRPGEFARYRGIFREQFEHSNNSGQFRLQLAVQTASVAAAEYAKSDPDPTVTHVLAQAMVDMDRPETVRGLIAGLKSTSAVARLLCASGLAAQRDAVAEDNQMLDDTVKALREAGVAETRPVVLSRIYHALAYANQVGAVFDAYMELLDKRLEHRRGPAVKADGADIQAYEFFRTRGVLASLNADQKAQLARRLAVFLRLDAERYNDDDLAPPQDQTVADVNFDERDRIERMLAGNEAILSALVGGAKEEIADALKAGGHARRAEILAHAYKWVGHPETKERGTLNGAPWNVDVGAP